MWVLWNYSAESYSSFTLYAASAFSWVSVSFLSAVRYFLCFIVQCKILISRIDLKTVTTPAFHGTGTFFTICCPIISFLKSPCFICCLLCNIHLHFFLVKKVSQLFKRYIFLGSRKDVFAFSTHIFMCKENAA